MGDVPIAGGEHEFSYLGFKHLPFDKSFTYPTHARFSSQFSSFIHSSLRLTLPFS